MSLSPSQFVQFCRDVCAEAKRVTWLTRRGTLVTTGAVVVMAGFMSIFFFVIDQLIGLVLRHLFGL
ncbi:MAG: preprotein translocase subunit SecE [Acetobacter sp.]|nr:preprotein translocase subunit SecE [Acetobacter sp.]